MGTRTTTITSSSSDNSKRDIIFSISIDDYQGLIRIVTEHNVNQIIDQNGGTALHYAIRANNDKMIEYLLKLGANPFIKNNANQDAFDLSLKFQSKRVITHTNDAKNAEVEIQKRKVSALERKINDLEINTNYLQKSIKDIGDKNAQFKTEIKDLQTRNTSLQTKNTQLMGENASLKQNLETVTADREKLKRKYEKLEESYDGLLSKISKK
jgi:FtsZ-binding cell division protein ZapB